MVYEEARKQGPALIVDSGNALFRATGLNDDASVKRAQFILSTMGKLGVQAMAPGARDLNLGVDWLKEQAAAAKVPIVSVNALGKDGKPAFPPSMTATVGGVKVGIIGVSPPVAPPAKPAAAGQPPAPPAAPESPAPLVIAEAKKLRPKVDVVLVLAALPYPDALQLSAQAKGDVDFIFQSHEGRGQLAPQASQGNFVVASGERGRQVGRLEINLNGKGPFVDLADASREAELAKMLDGQIAGLKTRLASAKDAKEKADLQQAIGNFEQNKAQHEKNARGPDKGARTVKEDWVILSPERPDDPALRAEVEKIEPGGGPH